MRARRSKRQSSRDATTRMQLLRSAPIISGVFKSSSPSATASTRRRAQISISCHRCPRLKPFVGPAALRAHVERVHSDDPPPITHRRHASRAAGKRRLGSKRSAPRKPIGAPDPDFAEMPSRLRPLVRAFYDKGYCTSPNGITREQVIACRREVYGQFRETMQAVKRLGLQEDLMKRGFSSFKLRHNGRYDMEIKQFDTPAFRYLRGDAPWLPLVKAILGENAVLGNAGVMLSLAGSETQPWHSDGDHLYKKHHNPYSVNVFVPLVTLTAKNGGTEMIPTSHIHGNYDCDEESDTPLVCAGEVILFDFRLKHRGLGNRSSYPRPVMYLTYQLPEFHDTMNFSTKRYLKLPELPPLAKSASTSSQRRRSGSRGKPRRATRSGFNDGTDVGSYFDHLVERDSEAEEDENESAQPDRKLSLIEKERIARNRHRALAQDCPRTKRGIRLYISSPVLAKDEKQWYAATITKIDHETRQLRIHFTGWKKRHDFTCGFDSPRIKPSSADVNVRHRQTLTPIGRDGR
eukprot:m.140621 g.140621  ORF g.140621 m.140621 type:complete len:519 (+) comp10015_c0_seq6:3-1559(+)